MKSGFYSTLYFEFTTQSTKHQNIRFHFVLWMIRVQPDLFDNNYNYRKFRNQLFIKSVTRYIYLETILDELEKLQKVSPKLKQRLTIEHFGESRPEQSARIAKLGAVVSANPYYLYYMGDKYVANTVLGQERGSEMVRLGSLVKNKVKFALHSDFTMAPIQPLLLAWIATNRVTADGTLMAPQERVTAYDSLKGITINAANLMQLDKITGFIKVGKKADFVILAENPLKIDPMKMKDIKILETVFEGKSFPIVKK